jgi:hypothetical protein
MTIDEYRMPATSGASHGLAAFVTLIVGTILSKLIWDLVPPLGQLSLFVIGTVRSVTGAAIPTSEQFAGTAFVMIVLSFVWGVVYHLGRYA